MLTVGTKVLCPYLDEEDGRIEGEIIAINRAESGFWSPEKFPYIIRWNDGYTDVYGSGEFTVAPKMI